ncbi:serine protease 42 [Drosophila bipectinata]|uniref:serine protease 42 n=1 Tax=Drosophila bipectinata TaxID=42026 RepID=UPI001C8AB189|nr:transmembrane protease serine 9 [Drosophila bipectinata]
MCQMRVGFLVLVLHCIWTCFGQNLPHISCPGIFQYLSYRGQVIGLLTLYLDSRAEENVVSIELSQPGRNSASDPGDLTIIESEDEVIFRLRNNEPIRYRIDFPTAGVIPKLTKVSVNDVVICQSSPFRGKSTKLSLSRYLKTTIPLVPLQPQRPSQPSISGQGQGLIFQSAQQPQRRPQVEEEFIGAGNSTNEFVPTVSRPEPRPQPTTPRPRPEPAPSSSTPVSTPTQVASATNYPKTIGQLNGVCGREKAIQTPFIHGGEAVERGQLPWMVTLLEHVGKEYNFLCGGTLISARTVISAAHCFRYGSRNLPGSRTTVSLGRNTLDFFTQGELRRVSLLLLHDQYNPAVYTDADLALLQLSEHVEFGDFIRPICLWNENYLVDLPSGHKSYVAGWGEDELGNRNSRQLKMTDTDIITQQECRGNLSVDNVRFVTSRTICASNSRAAGPCNGDSGGGLMLQEQDVWLLRGVVSAGQRLSNRCDLTQPVIYTDLAKHFEWLMQNIWF